MKQSVLLKCIAWTVMLCMFIALIPAVDIQSAFAAENIPEMNMQEFKDLCKQAQAYESRTEGEWIYAVIQPENYAVILAHLNTGAKTLRVPDRIGGADVVAIADGALQDHHVLESVTLPGNLNAIGDDAIPAGTLLRGYHGTYAQKYALKSGHAFQNLSEFDFADGVIDYADIRVDAFTRHSANSLTLRKLEASRLTQGSVFFLVDPENAYQISYYRVASMTDNGNGFVTISCETPVTDEVFNSIQGKNEKMMIDMSTLRLSDGVVSSAMQNVSSSETLELEINEKLTINGVEVTITGGYEATFRVPSYEGEKDSVKKATMELAEKTHYVVSVGISQSAKDDQLERKEYANIQDIATDVTRLASNTQKLAEKPYSCPLGVGYAFSYAGIVTLEVHLGLEFKITGEGSVEAFYETVTTYYGDTDGNSNQKNEVINKSINPQGKIEIRIGVSAEANLYLTAICIFQIYGFAGAEITLTYEAMEWDLSTFALKTGINCIDCVRIQAHFIVEVGMRAGLLKILNFEMPLEMDINVKVKVVDIKLVDWHSHLLPIVFYLELPSGKIHNSSLGKNCEHDTEDCPYGQSDVEVRLSRKVGNQNPLLMQFENLDPGFIVTEPDDPTEGYDEYRITGWHSSTKPTAENRVTFPYTIQKGDNILQAIVQQKQYVHFIYEDGTEVGPSQYLFPGETIVLPETDPNRVILKWAQVESPAYIVERQTVKIEYGATEAIMPTVYSDIYLCAFEAPPIQVNFYECVNGAPMYKTGSLTSKAGLVIEKPEDTEMCARFEDCGWQVVLGVECSFPFTVPAGTITDISLVHFLGTKPVKDDFTWITGSYEGTTHPAQSAHLIYEIEEDDRGKYAVITGRDNSYPVGDLYNLVIPSSIEGYTVRRIRYSAFNGYNTLEAVTIPASVESIGETAFAGCGNLKMVELQGETTPLKIGDSAFAGCINLTELKVTQSARIEYGRSSFARTGLISITAGRSIGISAFEECPNLQRVTVPPYCTSIGANAFYGCSNLREVSLAEGILSIGGNAFAGCTSLLELEIPDGVSCGSNLVGGCTLLDTLIVGDAPSASAFEVVPAKTNYSSLNELPSLKYVEIGAGYTSIGYGAFKNMYALETVVFPESMATIGAEAFYGTSLTEVKLTGEANIGNNAFASNPCLQTVEVTALTLGAGVFKDCPTIHTAQLTAQSIGSSTFENCQSLHTAVLSGMKATGDRAFANCISLENLTLPSDMANIGISAFEHCESLTQFPMPNQLETVQIHAFDYCTSLEELVFPDSVTTYGNKTSVTDCSLIYGCTSLRRLYIGGGYKNLYADGEPGNITYRESSTFCIGPDNNMEYLEIGEGVTVLHEPFDEYYTNVETLVLPSTLEVLGCDICHGTFRNFGMPSVTIKGNIKYIANNVFSGCQRLENVEIHGNNTLISRYCFANTPALKTVEFHGVQELELHVFQNSAVESVVLGDGIKKLGEKIFDQCWELRSIHIADTLESIYLQTLGTCPALEEMYVGGPKQVENLVTFGKPKVLEFGPGVERIFLTPAGGLGNLERLVLPEGLLYVCNMNGIGKNIKNLVLPHSLQEIEGNAFSGGYFETVEIQAGIDTITRSAFSDNPNLKKVIIHGSDVVIEDMAFANCPQLSELVIYGSVKSIGKNAFYNCGFTEVELPDGLESIGEFAFRKNEKCTRMVLPDTLQTLESGILYESNNVEYLKIGGVDNVSKAIFDSSEKQLKYLVLGEGVKSIPANAFEESSDAKRFPYLEKVILPVSLEEIGNKAFYGSNIRSFEYQGGNLKKIGVSAFENCAQLESVVIDSDFDVQAGSAFVNCTALSRVQLGDNITTVSSGMFSGCSALTEVDLPKNLITIGNYAFDGCSALSKIELPEGLKAINGYAFNNCSSLTSIDIPDSVTTTPVGSGIFFGCNLKHLRIGAGINPNAFFIHGMAKQMECVELAEGITDVSASLFQFGRYNRNFVNSVILPESLTSVRKEMFSNLYGASYIKLSSSVSEYITDGYSSNTLENTTLYTDTYNSVVATIADSLGASYVSMDNVSTCSAQLRISLDGVASADAFKTIEGNLFSRFNLPNVPVQDGYQFTGWYYDEACTTPVGDGDRFAGDTSLYAGFVPQDVTIFALKLPNDIIQMEGLTENTLLPAPYLQYAKQKQDNGIQMPATPVLEGYSFTGWHVDSQLYLPFENQPALYYPSVLYGGFVAAGQGGLMETGEDGMVLSNYLPTEMDGASIVLPEQMNGTIISAIAANAFAGLDIEEITLPAGLRHVDSAAFRGADSLRRLSISAANEYFSTMNGVLYNKDRTVLIRYPEGIRSDSFTVPSTVRSIAPGAFENCSYLRQITLPDDLESIGAAAFAQSGITKIFLPDSVKHLGERAFAGCLRMTSFTAYGLETIGAGALPHTISLAVNGPLLEGVLRETVVPADKQNLRYNIRYLSVWNGSEEIAVYGVEAGTALPTQAIGSAADAENIIYALYLDAELTQPCDLTVMPDENTNLYAEICPVFASEGITLDGGETGLIITAYNGNGGAVVLPRMIGGKNVIALGENMLTSALGSVSSIDIGSDVISIAETALHDAQGQPFAGTVRADTGSFAAGWAQDNGLRLSASIYTLSFNTMGGNRIASVQATNGALLRLSTPARTGYTFSGWYLDEACTSAAVLDENGLYIVPGCDTVLYAGWMQAEEAAPAFTFTETDEGMVITGYTGEESRMCVPESINGIPVTGIAERAFVNNAKITSVELPQSLVSIGENAFANMTGLETIVIPDSVESIGYGAFRYCTSLRSAHIGSGLTSLGKEAFRGAKNLTAFTVSDGGRFTQANGILYTDSGETLVCCPAGYTGRLEIPQGVACVQPYALADSGISSIVIPESVEIIGEGALYNCDSLTKFSIGDGTGVLYLSDRLLSGADALASVHLGSRVWGIGASAFFGCDALEEVSISPSVTFIDDTAFAAVNRNMVLTGSQGSAAQAYAASKGFTFISDAQDAVTRLAFDTESITLVIGRQAKLNVTVFPALPEGETLRWTSGNPDIAYVSGGVVYARSRGTAVITVSSSNGVKAEMEVTVKGTSAETMTMSSEKLYVRTGEQKALTVAVTPSWADTACEWFSDDENIATVDKNGIVTGVAIGTTVIRAKAESGCEAEAQVIVFKPVEEIRLTEGTANLTLNVIDNPTLQIHAEAYPADATNRELVYESSDEGVVSVDENGLITVWSTGMADITISNHYTAGAPATLTLQVNVVPYDISSATPPEVSPFSYTGYVQTPSLSFVIGDRVLLQNIDYTFQNLGTAQLGEHSYTLTGKGLFTGTLTGTYEIVEFKPTLTYSGKTIHEYGKVSINPSSNALGKVKYAYAPESDPETWTDGKPSEVGSYIVRIYIPDSYGVIGSELQIPMRIVNSYVKSITPSAQTIHLYAGQSATAQITFEMVEGSPFTLPNAYASKSDANSVISTWSYSMAGNSYRINMKASTSTVGEAEITLQRSDKSDEQVCLKIYVHQNPSIFRLPAIAQIEEEAFANTAANVIYLEGESVEIGTRAFYDSDALWQVVVPNGNATVSPDTFDATEAVLVCPSFTSQAALAAGEAGLPYIVVN